MKLPLRLMAHNLDKTLLERMVVLAEKTGGCSARQLRVALDFTPLCGAGRVEDTLNRLGHALRKAVDVAAQALATSTEASVNPIGVIEISETNTRFITFARGRRLLVALATGFALGFLLGKRAAERQAPG